LRQRRFFADPEAARGAGEQRWPVPMVLKIGGDDGIREERVLLADDRDEITLPGARWVHPNGGAAGFYRYALDDDAPARLASVMAAALTPEERLSLVGNQWVLVKAGVSGVRGFLRLLAGLRDENDRAVLDAIVERLSWLDTHAVTDAARAEFNHLVETTFAAQLARLGWDPKANESADERMKR